MALNESQQLLEFLILHLCLKCFWKRMVNNNLKKLRKFTSWASDLMMLFHMTLNNFMTFIVQKKSKSSDTIITQALYTCRYELRVAVSSSCYCNIDYLPSFLVTETQIVWSSKCQSRRPGVTLTAWMWQNWEKSLQENQEFTKCLKSKCSKGKFLNKAWPKKKELESLQAYTICLLNTGRLYM